MSRVSWVVIALGAIAAPARATFHLMQIEQVIGGVSGDMTAQAIQLRMRSTSQQFVFQARVRVWDATGANPILIADLDRTLSNGQAGDRVLITSPSFASRTSPTAMADFTMAELIPESYLAAGSLTFEEDGGAIYWRLSWGGSSYTGATTGQTDNDDDPGSPADFGPPFEGALPSTTLQALQFTGEATALSTTNLADYAVTAGASTFTNNARNSFTVIAPAPVVGDIDGDRDVDVADFARCVTCLAGPIGEIPSSCASEDFAACDLHEDLAVDLLDVAELVLLISAP